jgi:hypothetical protein
MAKSSKNGSSNLAPANPPFALPTLTASICGVMDTLAFKNMETTMRFIASLFFFLGAMLPAQSATNEDAAKARNDFDNCVYFSVADQLKTRSVQDLSMVTENGFRACRSEEAILRAFMKKELFLSPESIEASILKIRVSIKRHVREIANNPQIVDGKTAVPTTRSEPNTALSQERCTWAMAVLSNGYSTQGQNAFAMEVARSNECL